jgi:hypothetical protein
VAYRDSVEAFVDLVSTSHEEASEVRRIEARIKELQNGIRYCSIQVTFGSGAEYRVEAFGEEAEELYSKARARLAALEICVR